MSNVVVCAPPTFPLRRITYCPTCDRRRRFSGRDAAWYGVTWTCCTCGDAWGDGERLPRPFHRGWREDAASRARLVWENAGSYTKAQYHEWLQRQIAGAS